MISNRTMTPADLPVAMRLSSQAGWNQIESDWRRFLAMQPDGCFMADFDGIAVGTTVACIFDDVAWIAMVLVDPAVRGRGIGTALVRHALEFLDGTGIASVRLDATSLGQPLYEKLGFRSQYNLARYEGMPTRSIDVKAQATIREGWPGDVDEIMRLDRATTRTNRRKFVERLIAERPSLAASCRTARPNCRLFDRAQGPLCHAARPLHRVRGGRSRSFGECGGVPRRTDDLP